MMVSSGLKVAFIFVVTLGILSSIVSCGSGDNGRDAELVVMEREYNIVVGESVVLHQSS